MSNRRLYEGPRYIRVKETDAANTWYPVDDDPANNFKSSTNSNSTAQDSPLIALLGYSVMDWNAAATDMTVIIQSHDGSREYLRLVIVAKDFVDRYVPLGIRGRTIGDANEKGFRIVVTGGPAEFVLDYEVIEHR